MGTVTGKDASVCIYSGSAKTHSVWGLSDFSLTFDRGTVEQELVGETGNWFDYGALSAEGSFTNCKFAASGNHDPLSSIVDSCYLTVSGNTGSNLSWFLVSCQVTSWDVSIGDADTITESSVDFTVMDPYNITIDTGTGRITDA
jgi:hypothetical protein